MKLHKWSNIKRERFSPEEIERIDREVSHEIFEMNLRELREAAGQTQTELATLAEMSQAEVSRLERRDDHMLSTLRRVVKALGGEVEVHARFPGRIVVLKGV